MEACRRGSPRLLLGLQTKAASLLNELFPGTTARLMALVNRLLPTCDKTGSKEIHVGWESGSARVPSVLTRLTEQAALKNNEAGNG